MKNAGLKFLGARSEAWVLFFSPWGTGHHRDTYPAHIPVHSPCFKNCHWPLLHDFLPNPSQFLWPPRLQQLRLVPLPVHSPTHYPAPTLCHTLGSQPQQIKALPSELTFRGDYPRPGGTLSFSSVPYPSCRQSSNPRLTTPGGLTLPASPPRLCTLTRLHSLCWGNFQRFCDISPMGIQSHPPVGASRAGIGSSVFKFPLNEELRNRTRSPHAQEAKRC